MAIKDVDLTSRLWLFVTPKGGKKTRGPRPGIVWPVSLYCPSPTTSENRWATVNANGIRWHYEPDESTP